MPNLYVMTSDEIRDWARKRKEYLGWTNAELSEKSGVPKGTIDSNFSKNPDKNTDVKYSTFAPILCALIGADGNEMQCRGQSAYNHDESVEILKNQIAHEQETAKIRLKIIRLLAFSLAAVLVIIIIALAYDNLNPEIGFIR